MSISESSESNVNDCAFYNLIDFRAFEEFQGDVVRICTPPSTEFLVSVCCWKHVQTIPLDEFLANCPPPSYTDPSQILEVLTNCFDCLLSESSESSSSFDPLSESSSSSEPAGGYSGTTPAINFTLSGGGGYPRTFLGKSFSDGETISIESESGKWSQTASKEGWRYEPNSTSYFWASDDSAGFGAEMRFKFGTGAPSTTPHLYAYKTTGGSTSIRTYYFNFFTGSDIDPANFVVDGKVGSGMFGAMTPNKGPFSGVTIKWEKGPDGSVDAWKV
jgi:hypothetical protein